MSTGALGNGFLFAERYKVVRLLGQGGMGAVYLVEDQLMSNELVALKVLPEQISREEVRIQRFLREVQLARKITSNNVVKTFDVNIWNESPYFTMEYIEGESLKDKISPEGMELNEALRILKEICQGLKVIHDSGIVHRDIKPANIMITTAGEIKIADFGIANRGSSDLTAQDEIIGSNHYIAPEIWSGKEVDNRSDIYALGVMVYQMLTGKLPYDGDSPAQIMYKHLEGKAEPPDILNDSIPLWLSKLIMQMMAVKSDERPQYVEDILAAIQNGNKTAEKVNVGGVSITSSGRFGYEPLKRSDAESDHLWGGTAGSASMGSGMSILGAEKKILNPQFGAKNVEIAESERKIIPKVKGLASVSQLLSYRSVRLLIAFAFSGIFLLLLFGPLGRLQKGLWEQLILNQASLGGSLVFLSVINLIFYALIFSLPVLILSAFFTPVINTIKNYILSTLIFTMLGFLQVSYFSLTALLKFKEFHDKFEFKPLIVGIQLISEKAVQNTFEAALLMPFGSIFKCVIQNGLPAFVDADFSGFQSAWPYYLGLGFVVFFTAFLMFARILPESGRGLHLLVIIISVVILIALQILIKDIVIDFIGAEYRKDLGGIFGVYYLSFNKYSLLCGLINWIVIALYCFIIIPILERKESRYVGVSGRISQLTNRKN